MRAHLAKKARKNSIVHFPEAANRLEGKVESSDESAGNVVFNVVISAPRPHRPAIGDGRGHDEPIDARQLLWPRRTAL